MSVNIKIDKCVPFPPESGVYVRLVMADSPDKENSVMITQGHVMLFDGNKVVVLDKGQETTPEIVLQGDQLCSKENLIVAYIPIIGVGITKKPAPTNNLVR